MCFESIGQSTSITSPSAPSSSWASEVLQHFPAPGLPIPNHASTLGHPIPILKEMHHPLVQWARSSFQRGYFRHL